MYTVNISPIQGLPFIGTGFLGKNFSTRKELREIILEHAFKEIHGEYYLIAPFRMSFYNAATTAKIRENGNSQAKKGNVNLFSFLPIIKQDPFIGIEIYYNSNGFTIGEGHWCICKNNKYTTKSRLTEVLAELGIILED